MQLFQKPLSVEIFFFELLCGPPLGGPQGLSYYYVPPPLGGAQGLKVDSQETLNTLKAY